MSDPNDNDALNAMRKRRKARLAQEAKEKARKERINKGLEELLEFTQQFMKQSTSPSLVTPFPVMPDPPTPAQQKLHADLANLQETSYYTKQFVVIHAALATQHRAMDDNLLVEMMNHIASVLKAITVYSKQREQASQQAYQESLTNSTEETKS